VAFPAVPHIGSGNLPRSVLLPATSKPPWAHRKDKGYSERASGIWSHGPALERHAAVARSKSAKVSGTSAAVAFGPELTPVAAGRGQVVVTERQRGAAPRGCEAPVQAPLAVQAILAFPPVTPAIPGVRLGPAGQAACRPPASRGEGAEGAACVRPMRHLR